MFEAFSFDVEPPPRVPTGSSNSSVNGTANVTTNAVDGYEDFWNDKMIQATNQVDEVSKYTVPDFQAKIAETHNIVSRMIALNADRLTDAAIVLAESTKDYRIALEILVNVKNLPTYNNTVDLQKQWVNASLLEILKILPRVLANSAVLQKDAQDDLNFLKATLSSFTADRLRRLCYPNVRCATLRLSQLKDLIFKTREKILRVVNLFIGYSISIDSLLYTTITHQKNIIYDTSKAYGLSLLQINNVTISEINNYFIRYHLSQNDYSLYVQSQLNKTMNCIFEFDYRNVRCKSMTRNAIAASGYPVVDAYNTVNLLGRNRNQKVLGNETQVTREKVQRLLNEMTPKAPNFEADIAIYLAQVSKQNTSIYSRTDYYFSEILFVDFKNDPIEWYSYLDTASRDNDATFLDVVSKDLEFMLKDCTAKVVSSTHDYNKWLGGTLPTRIDEFHLKELEPIGDGLYTKGNITHNEIFYFGSLNLNATYRTWKPKFDDAITNIKDAYNSIQAKNYSGYSIFNELFDIVDRYVFETFDKNQDVFNSDLIKLLNTTAVTQLVKIPADEYLRLVKDSAFEVNKKFNKSSQYNGESARIRKELDIYIKKGPQSYDYHRSPRVEHSHVLSSKVYQTKVEFVRVIDDIDYLRKEIESIDQAVDIYSATIKSKILAVCQEYAQVIETYAAAERSGNPYVNTLPSSFAIFARYFREAHMKIDATNPTVKVIDLAVF